MLNGLVQDSLKILLIVLLSGCGTRGSIKIFNVEKEHGMVRRNDKGGILEVITLEQADRKMACMYWEDIRTSVEFIQVCETIRD